MPADHTPREQWLPAIDNAAPGPVRLPVNGIYTVVYDLMGNYRTLRVADCNMDNVEPGMRVISYLAGPDNESMYHGCAFLPVRGNYKVWKKYQGPGAATIRECIQLLMRGSDEEQKEMGTAYAMMSGRCWVCNRTLTTPESISAGIGPICAARIG